MPVTGAEQRLPLRLFDEHGQPHDKLQGRTTVQGRGASGDASPDNRASPVPLFKFACYFFRRCNAPHRPRPDMGRKGDLAGAEPPLLSRRTASIMA